MMHSNHIPQLPKHDEDCDHKKTGEYRVGCLGCIQELIQDSRKSLSKEIGDMVKTPDWKGQQYYIEKVEFLIRLENNFP